MRVAILLLRWSARTLGLFLVGLVVLFAVGEGFDPRELTGVTAAMSVAFLLAATGLLLLWRWEKAGGLTVVMAMAAFYGLNYAAAGRLPSGWVFPLFFVVGFMAVVAGSLGRDRSRASTDQANLLSDV